MAMSIDGNKTATNLEEIVLAKVHKLCETYQQNQLAANAWTSTSSNAIGKCVNNNEWDDFKRIMMMLIAFSTNRPTTAVTRYLLNSRFWSATVNNDNLIHGNLTSTHPITINMENFANRIDIGSPTPEESGETLLSATHGAITISAKRIFFKFFSFSFLLNCRRLPGGAFASAALCGE